MTVMLSKTYQMLLENNVIISLSTPPTGSKDGANYQTLTIVKITTMTMMMNMAKMMNIISAKVRANMKVILNQTMIIKPMKTTMIKSVTLRGDA